MSSLEETKVQVESRCYRNVIHVQEKWYVILGGAIQSVSVVSSVKTWSDRVNMFHNASCVSYEKKSVVVWIYMIQVVQVCDED